MSLSGKRIVVGITGGIAAYKTIEFIRLLRKSNAEVRVALTPAAAEFVTPLTLQAISGHAVSQSLLDPQAELAMGHIELAKWADAIVIAPASADFIARLTVGMANDLLSTICLATSAPIFARSSDESTDVSSGDYTTKFNRSFCARYSLCGTK